LCFLWFFAATKILIPHFATGEQPYYVKAFFGNWGDTMSEVVKNVATNPFKVWQAFTTQENLRFLGLMLFCFGGIGLAAPTWLLSGMPFIIWSTISSSSTTRSIRFQYTNFTIPFIVVASIIGASRIWGNRNVLIHPPSRLKVARIISLCIFAPSLLATQIFASPNPAFALRNDWWDATSNREQYSAALKFIGADDRVSASSLLSSHIGHRTAIFDFPNPFVQHFYGTEVEVDLDPNSVDKLIIMKHEWTSSPREDPVTLDFLLKNKFFSVIYENDHVLVAKKIRQLTLADVGDLRAQLAVP
jgi:uncharacterized membrane protein